jgi:hypothetical protein
MRIQVFTFSCVGTGIILMVLTRMLLSSGAASWLARAEYYRHGAHVLMFDTLGDLVRMLGGAVDLSRASVTALRWHSEEERGAHSGWKEAIGRVISGYEPGARGKAAAA